MKTILKLAITAVVLHGVYQSGLVAWRYFELKDAAQQALLFGGGSTPGQLHAQILEQAMELGLPLRPEQLDVRRTGRRTVAEAHYSQPVEFFPRFTYPVDLSFVVDAVGVF